MMRVWLVSAGAPPKRHCCAEGSTSRTRHTPAGWIPLLTQHHGQEAPRRRVECAHVHAQLLGKCLLGHADGDLLLARIADDVQGAGIPDG